MIRTNSVWQNYIDINNLSESHICPICGFCGRFESKNSNSFECPHCGSQDRDRLYWLYIVDHNLDAISGNILHFNPQKGMREKLWNRPDSEYRVLGVSDLCCISVDDESEDVIIANYVIDRSDDPSAALFEVARVLRPNGLAMVSVFFSKNENLTSIPRKYTKDTYMSLVRSAGLDAKVFTASDFYNDIMLFICAIAPETPLVVARKPLF